jgi:hypothetical protein
MPSASDRVGQGALHAVGLKFRWLLISQPFKRERDYAISRRKHGFDSRWGANKIKDLGGTRTLLSQISPKCQRGFAWTQADG